MTASPEDVNGIVPATAETIRLAAERLRAGDLIIIPTETVYGVAVRQDSPEAMARLYAAKGREETKRLATFTDSIDSIQSAGVPVSDIAVRLASAFWPGPLTMVLQNAAGGWDGFRMPDHPVALAWLRELDFMPAVTSANRSGEPAACTAQEAWAALAPAVSLALDDGPSPQGVASTVVRVEPDGLTLLRAGSISREALAAAADCPVRE
jgi:tRNA threonylcarbamoyl adenosine modification protein (Sua5/YciO/YrdC/YwlC family)